jgi:RNA polymerase sigma-70 factor (ECF subfamily)
MLLNDSASGDQGEVVDNELLVSMSKKGDLKAFDQLVTQHRQRIYSMIFHLTMNEADAWDLTQECFVKAWKSLPQFKGESQFFSWLYRIGHNLTYDWLRKQKRSRFAGELNEELGEHRPIISAPTTPQMTPAPDQMMERDEVAGRLKSAIATLPADQHQTIILREIEGMSYEEIAQMMNCSTGTVMSRLFYARKKLQDQLKDLFNR